VQYAARPGRGSIAPLAALAVVTAAAWVALLRRGDGMEMEAVPFVGGWTLMMTAMMVPSIAPLVLLVRRSRRAPTGVLAGGYLAVWAATGLAAYAAVRSTDVESAPAWAVATVLAAAGIYQLTPLKRACLRRCRSPVDLLVRFWKPGWRGALRVGVAHGASCVGCCWALMAVLVGAGAMGLEWAAAISLAVVVEKVVPRGETVAKVLGIALIVSAAAVAAAG
jgi:predicted metal-binding membrane protein